MMKSTYSLVVYLKDYIISDVPIYGYDGLINQGNYIYIIVCMYKGSLIYTVT